jgi:hypothetical protein
MHPNGDRSTPRDNRSPKISATDAIVVAFATGFPDAVVLTSDPNDLTDLVETQPVPVTISAV